MNGVAIAKWLMIMGAGLVFVGLLVWVGTKLGFSFGKLPGDVSFKGKHTAVYFPIVTCLIISVFLTLLLNLFWWFFRK